MRTWGLTLRSLEGFHHVVCVRVVFKGCDVRWNGWCHQHEWKTAPTYLVQNRITYTIFHIIKTQEATANIERLQQHESLDTTRSAARIDYPEGRSSTIWRIDLVTRTASHLLWMNFLLVLWSHLLRLFDSLALSPTRGVTSTCPATDILYRAHVHGASQLS